MGQVGDLEVAPPAIQVPERQRRATDGVFREHLHVPLGQVVLDGQCTEAILW